MITNRTWTLRTTDPPPVDLTNCHAEPIHIPGRVQSHGYLVAVDPDSQSVRWISQNLATLVGRPETSILGAPLAELLGPETTREILERSQLGRVSYSFSDTVTFGGPDGLTRLDVVLHRHDDMIVLEFEPPAETSIALDQSATEAARVLSRLQVGGGRRTSVPLTHAFQATLDQIRFGGDLQSVFATVAEEVRALTGFSRVMVYRFEPDGHGVVVAEAADELRYRGLNFPATDIPAQARDLYRLNWIRTIYDVEVQPTALLGDSSSDRPLDLTYAVLRAVSPIHIEYLKNMGVRSSSSVSLVDGDNLWGLIACHHDEPLLVPHPLRSTLELLSVVLSSYIVSRRRQAEAEELVSRRMMLQNMVERLSDQNALPENLIEETPVLQDLFRAEGVTFVSGNRRWQLGLGLGVSDLASLVAYVAQADEPMLVTETLSTWRDGPVVDGQVATDVSDSPVVLIADPDLAPSGPRLAGALAFRLSRNPLEVLFVFRKEQVQTVPWAGRPDKVVASVEGEPVRLSPRKSFARYNEIRQGHSEAWTSADLILAEETFTAVLSRLVEQSAAVRQVNEELKRLNADLDVFAAAASHDLREPLRGLHHYLTRWEQVVDNPARASDLSDASRHAADPSDLRDSLSGVRKMIDRMDELVEGMLNFARVGRRDIDRQPIDMVKLLGDVVDVLRVTRPDRPFESSIQDAFPPVDADYSLLREIITNLYTNAIKYNLCDIPRIEVGWSRSGDLAENPFGRDDLMVLSVSDNGIGIAKEYHRDIFQIFRRLHNKDEYGGGTGAGLTVVKTMIARHGGKIWLQSEPGRGTTFYFTLEPERRVERRAVLERPSAKM